MVILDICWISELKRTTMVSGLLVVICSRHACVGAKIFRPWTTAKITIVN